MPELSVVIPTLNEERTIESCLQAVGRRQDVEAVVSDGASADGTVRRARSMGALVVEGPPGRGGQLNRGAAATQAEWLLFLHADCRLPLGWHDAVATALADPANSLGCFRLHTEPPPGTRPSPVQRVWLRTLDLRSRGLRLPYGDQAFAVRREVFDRVGGFPDIPLMEDLAFARDCRKVGRIRRLPLEIRTTARRTDAYPVRARLMMLVFPWLFRFGVPPGTLARWYGNAR
jgi:rSAM/selenodomain-associated transferase 2